MIVIGSKGEAECVLHAIFGPETELSMDVLGVSSVDISKLVAECPKDAKVTLKLTRSRNEYATALALNGSKVPYLASFKPVGAAEKKTAAAERGVNYDIGLPDMDEHDEHNGVALQEKSGESGESGESACGLEVGGARIGKCSYCGSSSVLLDIPGFEICQSCATIELGRRRADKIRALG